MDGLCTKDGSGTDLIIESSQGKRHEHTLKFMFKASNNEVEYPDSERGIILHRRGGLGPCILRFSTRG